MNMSTHISVVKKHRALYLRVCRAHTHPKQSTLPVTRVNTCTHRSSIFQQVRKLQLIKFNPTDKIPTYEHLCSDQYYHINSIANPHIGKQQTQIIGIMQNRNLTLTVLILK